MTDPACYGDFISVCLNDPWDGRAKPPFEKPTRCSACEIPFSVGNPAVGGILDRWFCRECSRR